MNPWPGAYTSLNGRRIKIHRADFTTLDTGRAEPGEVIALDQKAILVACGDGALELHELQESGRKRVDAGAFIAGRGIELGDRFTKEGADK